MSNKNEKQAKYRQLKEHKGTVTIKVEEVLRPIFARGLLSKRESQVVWAIIADSWRWGNGQFTQHQVTLGSLSRDTGLDKSTVSRIVAGLVAKNIIKFNRDREASFNEHFNNWRVDKRPTPNPSAKNELADSGVDKTPTRGVDKTPKDTPLKAMPDGNLRDPKNNRNKNISKSPGVERRINYEFNAVRNAVLEKFGVDENAKRIQLALNECEAANLHPLNLISRATHKWLGYVRTACRNPDSYRDTVQGYVEFAETVTPMAPEVKEMVNEAATTHA